MRLVLTFSLMVLVFLISSCSTNENDPIVSDDPESDPILLTVNAAEIYHISLSQKKTVDVVDPLLENSWDICIDNLTHITVNGGSTAPGKVYVHKIETEDYSQVKAAPDGMYATDTQKNGAVIGENWYFYDVSTHSVSPLDYVYIIKTSEGEYYKFRISETVFTSRTDGELKILIDKVPAPAAPEFQDPSGRIRTAVFTLSADKITYFQLSKGEEVEITNPASSNEWDISSDFVTLSMNGGTSGPGQAGAILDQETVLDSISSAPVDGYVMDDSTQSKMAIGDAWYNYDFMTHSLSAYDYSWVLKTASGKYAKLEFVKTDFSGQSAGLVVIRFMYLESGNQF
jgi:hypothetical protein